MPNDTMQAVRYDNYGGPDQLKLERVPRPQVQPGTILVRIMAAGVNPMDWKLRSGMLKNFRPLQFPFTPGLEFAGMIEEIGSGVNGFERGQAVYGTGTGTNAEYAVVPATAIAPKPSTLTFDQAAAIPIGALTAWRAMDKANLQPGQRVLVLGAAGGVGSFVVQMARDRGAHVIGTASAKNQDYVRSLGAESIDYLAHPVETVVHDVDVVIDTVGGDTGVRALQSLRRGGVFVEIAGQPPQEQAQKLGVKTEGVGPSDPARNGEILREINKLIKSGKIKVQVTTVFPLAGANQAHVLSETGHGRGRIILHVAD